jgi:hypothetical protein
VAVMLNLAFHFMENITEQPSYPARLHPQMDLPARGAGPVLRILRKR